MLFRSVMGSPGLGIWATQPQPTPTGIWDSARFLRPGGATGRPIDSRETIQGNLNDIRNLGRTSLPSEQGPRDSTQLEEGFCASCACAYPLHPDEAVKKLFLIERAKELQPHQVKVSSGGHAAHMRRKRRCFRRNKARGRWGGGRDRQLEDLIEPDCVGTRNTGPCRADVDRLRQL